MKCQAIQMARHFNKKTMKKVKVKIPATIANLVCGFDILGMAIHEPYDEMEMILSDEPGLRIRHTDAFGLPTDPLKNIAGVSLLALMKQYGKPIGFDLTVHKNIKPGSGLGSSAAAAVGSVFAANYLLNDFFSKENLLGFAMEGEQLASGAKHADNIAPCLYGAVTLIRSLSPLDIVTLKAPPLFVTVVHPQIEIKTSEARQILPKEVKLADAIHQWANIAGLVTGFLKNDYKLIGRSLEDVLIEPVRAVLIPGFDEIKKRSKKAGALGGGISGSGPSVFMLSEHEKTAIQVEEIMTDVYNHTGIEFKTYVTTINNEGMKIVK
jgi:homoserine kinase